MLNSALSGWSGRQDGWGGQVGEEDRLGGGVGMEDARIGKGG